MEIFLTTTFLETSSSLCLETERPGISSFASMVLICYFNFIGQRNQRFTGVNLSKVSPFVCICHVSCFVCCLGMGETQCNLHDEKITSVKVLERAIHMHNS